MKQIFILRHGQSVANAEHKINGSLDSPLSELGRRQAQLAAQNAQKFFAFDYIVTSPLMRAQETAEIIGDVLGLSPALLADLRERDLGQMEGKSFVETPRYNGNAEDVEDTPGLEPLQSLRARAEHVLEMLHSRPEQCILVVCHNGIGRMLRVAVRGGEPRELYDESRLDNAIFYRLQ